MVPSPVVPRPLVPSPDAPRPDTSSAEFAVAVAEIPELDEEDDEVAPLPELFEELMTSELLSELHGTDVLAVAPTAPDNPDVGELVERLTPPPSNVGSAAVPGFPEEQGAGFAVPE